MTTLSELKQARKEFDAVMDLSRSLERPTNINREVTNLAFKVRSLSDLWYAEEVHQWPHLVPTTKILANWDKVMEWCNHYVGEDNYLLYLPRGERKVLCLRDPGHLTYIKLAYG